MIKPYVQKDLGYPREKTDAKLRVMMPDGYAWDVPVQLIADSRDEYYKKEQIDAIALLRNGNFSSYDISDWASNNMNWEDVQPFATKVEEKPPVIDYEDGWVSGDREIVGEI